MGLAGPGAAARSKVAAQPAEWYSSVIAARSGVRGYGHLARGPRTRRASVGNGASGRVCPCVSDARSGLDGGTSGAIARWAGRRARADLSVSARASGAAVQKLLTRGWRPILPCHDRRPLCRDACVSRPAARPARWPRSRPLPVRAPGLACSPIVASWFLARLCTLDVRRSPTHTAPSRTSELAGAPCRRRRTAA